MSEPPETNDDSLPVTASTRLRVWPAVALVIVIEALVYVWIVSAGTMWPPQRWPSYGTYYSWQSDAFLKGQTHLLIEPDPKLIALPDPYNPVANRDLRVHDAVLFDSKYYLVWGPVPALILAPLRAILPSQPPVPDSYLVIAFSVGIAVVTTVILRHVRACCFPDGSRLTLLLGVAAAGLAMPLPFLLARASVYEAAILGGQLFLLVGILLAMTEFQKEGVSWRRLLGAGACWALAVGCRATLAVAVVALAVLVTWRVFVRGRMTTRRTAFASVLAIGSPLLAGAVLLGWYNHLRFGSWRESGQLYVLTAVPLSEVGPNLFSTDNVLPAFVSYAARPWQSSADFPGIRAADGAGMIPSWVRVPPHYVAEHVTGVAQTTPLLACALVPLVILRRRLRRTTAGHSPSPSFGQWGLNWLVASLLCAAALGMLPAMFYYLSTMRFFADSTPSMFILATIGLWQLEGQLSARPVYRRRLLMAAVICTAYCVLVALMLALTGYQEHFRTHNPALLDRVGAWLGGG